MATQLFLRDEQPTLWQNARLQGYVDDQNNGLRDVLTLATTRGDAGVTSSTVNTAQLFGGYRSVTAPSGRKTVWISEPLDADVTISGTITFNAWGLESSMSANFGLACRVHRLDNLGVLVSQIIDSPRNVELGTSAAVQNWTGSPTSTAMQKGDRLMVVYCFDEVGTGASGFTATFNYDGPTAAANGDTYITFTETFGFLTATPAGTKVYFRSTASPADGYDPDWNTLAMDTARGGAAVEKRALILGATSGGSVANPMHQFPGDTSNSETAWKLPTSAVNVDTGNPAWNNPTNVLTDNGSVTSCTTGVNGNTDELHMSGFGFDSEGVFGRVIAAGYRCECRQNPATGFDTLAYWSPNAFTGFAGFGTLTTTLTLYTHDPRMIQSFTTPILGAVVRDSAHSVRFHDDGSGSQGFTYEADYLEYKIYYREIYEWMTDQVASGFTLSGLVLANLRGARINTSSPDQTLGFEVAVVDEDGSNPQVFGWGYAVTDSTTTEAAVQCTAAGDDIVVSAGQRLRFRVSACGIFSDFYGASSLTNPPEQRFFYDGPTADASGDSWVQLTQSITFGAPGFAAPFSTGARSRDRYELARR